jgi:hypothetical protein
MSEFGIVETGSPHQVADRLGAQIRGEHDAAVDPQGWQFSLRGQCASTIETGIRQIGMSLVGRDLQARTDAYAAKIAAWRAGVEAERAKYDALPLAQQKGFVAPAEPDWGPLPEPLPITAHASGSVDDEDGITTLSITVVLED